MYLPGSLVLQFPSLPPSVGKAGCRHWTVSKRNREKTTFRLLKKITEVLVMPGQRELMQVKSPANYLNSLKPASPDNNLSVLTFTLKINFFSVYVYQNYSPSDNTLCSAEKRDWHWQKQGAFLTKNIYFLLPEENSKVVTREDCVNNYTYKRRSPPTLKLKRG